MLIIMKTLIGISTILRLPTSWAAGQQDMIWDYTNYCLPRLMYCMQQAVLVTAVIVTHRFNIELTLRQHTHG